MDVNKKINEAIKALQLHDYEKTIKFCKEIILANIDISEVYNLYGLALQKKKLFKDSIEKFKKAIEINLNNFEAYNNLAISLKYTNELNLAEEMYLKCLKINPKFVNGMVNLAKIKVEKKQYEEAIKLLIKSISITPIEYKVFILNQLTYVYSIIGKFNEAKINAEETLKIDKHNIFAIKLLSDLTDHKKNSNIIKKMESMINSSNITEQGISLLAFQLGKAFEQKNDFKKAYNYFDIGNKIKKKNTKSFLPQILKMKDDLIKCFTNFKFSNCKKSYEKNKSIFIIGLPRSGTTLVEQIVSSHSEVSAAGEIQILKNIIHDKFYKDNKLLKSVFFEDIQSKINLLQTNYFNDLSKKNINSKIITDKSIENFFYVGFIKVYFPNAKIVFVKRKREDVFLSIFQTDFSTPFMNWSYDKKEILEYMNIYNELINFWETIIDDNLYTIEYEKLLENPSFEIRNLINFCDLKWDPKCLSHEKNSSGIQTASMMQARKPIYKSSRNKSENYSEFLKNIFILFENENLK